MTAVLVLGYVLAVPVCVRLVPVLRERRVRWFVALLVGTAMIVAGHAAADRPGAAGVNVVFFVLFCAGWVWWPRHDAP